MTFNTMWEVKNKNKPLDVPKLPKYIYDETTYRPGAKDENGKMINDTRFDKVVKGSKTDLQEYIQSFADECDIYKILERCARSGDYTALLADNDNYGDTSMFKADRAENDKTLKHLQNVNGQAPSELAQALLSGATDEEILSIIEKLKASKDSSLVSPEAEKKEVTE